MKSSFTYFSKELTAIYSVYSGKKLETHKSREKVTAYLSHSFKTYQLMINLVLSTQNSTHTFSPSLTLFKAKVKCKFISSLNISVCTSKN